MASIVYPSMVKKAVLKDGTTYSYAYRKARAGKPTILFLHGYPSSSFDWRHQVPYFSEKGYGLIVPDLLGYGDSSKPTHWSAYGTKAMGKQVAELLDIEGHEKVIAVAHDWGCGLLSSMARFHQQRFSALVFTSVGYWARMSFDVDALNAKTQKELGYPIFGYWTFHNQDDAGQVIAQHTESITCATYPADPKVWIKHMCPIGEIRRFLESDSIVPRAKYISDEEYATHNKILSAGPAGYDTALNWYRYAMRADPDPEETSMTNEQQRLHVPTLFIRSEQDYICLADSMEQGTRAYVDEGKMHVASLDTSHWAMLEQPQAYNKIVEDFVNGPAATSVSGSASL